MRALMTTPIMEGDTEKQITRWNIDFENVSFSYNTRNPREDAVIKNLTVSIPSDAITALVGPSGCGKSTISRLIARFWDVNQGCVKIGGVDVKTLDPEHLMSYMSFVFQDVILLMIRFITTSVSEI